MFSSSAIIIIIYTSVCLSHFCARLSLDVNAAFHEDCADDEFADDEFVDGEFAHDGGQEMNLIWPERVAVTDSDPW